MSDREGGGGHKDALGGGGAARAPLDTPLLFRPPLCILLRLNWTKQAQEVK